MARKKEQEGRERAEFERKQAQEEAGGRNKERMEEQLEDLQEAAPTK